MVLHIACDEAGFTGPDLLSKDQRYFAFATINIEDDEAWSIIRKARTRNPVQMPELKAARLLRSARGRALIVDIFDAVDSRFAINAHDKLLALCGWVFEYIYEPVFQDDPRIFYDKDFHRFVAMFCWLWLQDQESGVNEAIEQFQRYMRTRNIEDAPLYFKQEWEAIDDSNLRHPFECVLRFAAGYREVIAADNKRLDRTVVDGGRWILDLSASALWSHLNHWGQHDLPLVVNCDVSKPLQAIVEKFSGDESDPGIRRARQLGFEGKMGWKLHEPVNFVDSRDRPSVQLADIIGGTAVHIFSNGLPEGFDRVAAVIDDGMLKDSIFPDMDIVDLEQRAPAVNYLVMYDLAQRAEKKPHPISGLVDLYHAAEVSWASGKFQLVKP